MLATSWSFFFSSRRRHTRSKRDWSSDVCSSDLRRNRTFLSWSSTFARFLRGRSLVVQRQWERDIHSLRPRRPNVGFPFVRHPHPLTCSQNAFHNGACPTLRQPALRSSAPPVGTGPSMSTFTPWETLWKVGMRPAKPPPPSDTRADP